jgi:uncharacterized protein involved in outer membrane biogenesis
MAKRRKLGLWLRLALALLALVMGTAVASGPLIAWSVAHAGRSAVGVPVGVAAAWPTWPLGVSLRGLVVANPPGFRSEPALSIGRIGVRVTPHGLSADPLVVEEVTLSNPLLRVDVENGRTNLQALQRRAQAASGDAGGRRIVIRRLRI